MKELLLLMLFGSFGAALSVFYTGGLWLTVRRLPHAGHAKTLLLSSFVVRTGVVLAGFYVIVQTMGAQWEWLVLALLGFVGARVLLVRHWGLSRSHK